MVTPRSAAADNFLCQKFIVCQLANRIQSGVRDCSLERKGRSAPHCLRFQFQGHRYAYFPYPSMPWPISIRQGQWRTAVYRLTVDRQGNVGEIKILKRMGVVGDWPADVTALKTLVRWRATPGPTRIIDVAWTLYPGYRFITNEGSHIPRH
jgi:hypothetical protein